MNCQQPPGINPIHRVVVDVGVEVRAAEETDRVGGSESARLRGVIAAAVVIEAGFRVELPSREGRDEIAASLRSSQ